MNRAKLHKHEQLRDSTDKIAPQRAHQLRRSALSAFLFQVIGNRHVLLAAIKHPIFSAAPPDADRSSSSAEQPDAVLQAFMKALEKEKQTDAYKERVQVSQKRTEGQGDMKNAAHEARRNVALAAKINSDIESGDRKWEDLNGIEIAFLDDFNGKQLHRLQKGCDEAFGWHRHKKSAAGSAAARLSSYESG